MFTSILFLSYISYLFHIVFNISTVQTSMNTMMKMHSEIIMKKKMLFPLTYF